MHANKRHQSAIGNSVHFTNKQISITTILSISTLLTACGGGDSTSMTAEHCFDDAIYQSSNKIEQQLSKPNDGTAVRTYSTSAQTVSFNGASGLTEQTISYLDLRSIPIGSYTDKQYLAPQAPHIYKNYGFIRQARSDIFRTGTYTYSTPVIDRRAVLELGASLDYLVQGNLKVEPGATVTPIDDSYTISYIGDDSVAIGSRNVNACKFKVSKNGQASYEWIYKSVSIQRSDIDQKIFNEKTSKLTNNGINF